jgi:hypothetical protein
MKYFKILFAFILFVSFSACSSLDVSSDYDTTYNFSELKTYKWHPRKREPKQVKHRAVVKQIDGMIEKVLADRGMIKTDNEEVDFLVNYQAAIDGRLKAANYTVTVGYGGYGGWMHGGTGTTITSYDEGTLALDILDAEKNMLIYKSIAKIDMKEMEYDKTEMLDHIINQMLSGFPPGN